jgi:hypothetical protein
MARQVSRCSACSHPERGAIETLMARGLSYRVLAKRFGVSQAALGRHRRNKHCPEAVADKALAIALTGRDISLADLRRDESEGLLGHLVSQRGRLYNILDRAEGVGESPALLDLRAAAAIHSRLTANLEATARLLGEIGTHSTTVTNNLIVAPQYLELRAKLLEALSPPQFRAARMAVVAALREIETAEPSDEPVAIDAVATTTEEPIE